MCPRHNSNQGARQRLSNVRHKVRIVWGTQQPRAIGRNRKYRLKSKNNEPHQLLIDHQAADNKSNQPRNSQPIKSSHLHRWQILTQWLSFRCPNTAIPLNSILRLRWTPQQPYNRPKDLLLSAQPSKIVHKDQSVQQQAVSTNQKKNRTSTVNSKWRWTKIRRSISNKLSPYHRQFTLYNKLKCQCKTRLAAMRVPS